MNWSDQWAQLFISREELHWWGGVVGRLEGNDLIVIAVSMKVVFVSRNDIK